MEFLDSCNEASGIDVTSIQVNKNFQTRPHRDSANFGPSALISFGSFTGGLLRIWPYDDGTDEFQATPVEIRDPRKLQLFDGNQLHGTESFQGERFTIVFFKVKGAERTSWPLQRKLTAMGAKCQDWQVASL